MGVHDWIVKAIRLERAGFVRCAREARKMALATRDAENARYRELREGMSGDPFVYSGNPIGFGMNSVADIVKSWDCMIVGA